MDHNVKDNSGETLLVVESPIVSVGDEDSFVGEISTVNEFRGRVKDAVKAAVKESAVREADQS
jgi:hypothetical protein